MSPKLFAEIIGGFSIVLYNLSAKISDKKTLDFWWGAAEIWVSEVQMFWILQLGSSDK